MVVTQIPPYKNQGICLLIFWNVICCQLLAKSLSRYCTWQEGAALPKVAHLYRDSLQPPIGHFWGYKVLVGVPQFRIFLQGHSSFRALWGIRWGSVATVHSSISSFPLTGFAHCFSDVFSQENFLYEFLSQDLFPREPDNHNNLKKLRRRGWGPAISPQLYSRDSNCTSPAPEWTLLGIMLS